MKKIILAALLLTLLQKSYGQIGFPINVDFTVSGLPYWQPTATCMPGVAYQFTGEAAPVCSRNFYQWTFFGSNIRISDPSARNPTVIFPASIHDMVYSVKLTVDAINSSPNEICRGAGEKMKTNYVFVPKVSTLYSGQENKTDSAHNFSYDMEIVSDPFNTGSLFQGGWSTNNSSKVSVISAVPEKRLFFISNIMFADQKVLEFDVYADGVKVPVSFFESGSVAVQAGKIEIRQLSEGQNIKGSWKLLQESDVPATQIPWASYPSLNKEVLITNLSTAQNFVFEIGSTTGCSNVSCNVFIDGNVVKEQTGTPAVFVPGSSFIGFGKRVTVKAQGTCVNPTSTPITGSLRLHK